MIHGQLAPSRRDAIYNYRSSRGNGSTHASLWSWWSESFRETRREAENRSDEYPSWRPRCLAHFELEGVHVTVEEGWREVSHDVIRSYDHLGQDRIWPTWTTSPLFSFPSWIRTQLLYVARVPFSQAAGPSIRLWKSLIRWCVTVTLSFSSFIIHVRNPCVPRKNEWNRFETHARVSNIYVAFLVLA